MKDIEETVKSFKENKNDIAATEIFNFIKMVNKMIVKRDSYNYDEDITTDAFIKVHQNIDSFDVIKGNFISWIYAIVKNEYLLKFRRYKLWSTDINVTDDYRDDMIEKRLDFEIPMFDEFDEDDSNILSGEDVLIAFEKFEYKTKKSDLFIESINPKSLFKMAMMESMDMKDIAKVTGINENSVKSAIRRCRHRFINFLREEYPNKVFPVQQYATSLKYERRK